MQYFNFNDIDYEKYNGEHIYGRIRMYDPGKEYGFISTEDGIDDVDSIIDEIVDVINIELPNYMENANPEDIVEYLPCCECGTESICINENVLPVGTCMNCGYVNEVHECERCHVWFNSDEDGRIIDNIAFCQNCLDEIEAE